MKVAQAAPRDRVAAILGRDDEATSRLGEAVRRNEAAGFTVWADHARDALG